jgi:cell wall-associated NlpC family hydrolase
MTLAQKRWLVGRLETQALYGTRVYLLDTFGAWSKIAVAGQPTPRNKWGYPGWLPTAQLTKQRPAVTSRVAMVRQTAVWLWREPDLTGRVLQVSYGTRLKTMAATPGHVEVVMLDGRHVYARRSAVALHTSGTPRPVLSGDKLVAQAKRFLGLEYLWAGASGYGVDCSGLTWAVHNARGTTIWRDAGPQSVRGAKGATRAALRAGDLVFFRDSAGWIHHVGLFVGGGRMIHAPRTGSAVATVSIYAEPYFSEFAGGRRYTP